MEDNPTRILNHFSLLAFQDAYWLMNEHAKASFHEHWLAALAAAATNFDLYQTTDSSAEMLAWCAVNAEELCAVSDFFERWATITTPYRHLIRPVASWSGYARVSAVLGGPPSGDIDPLSTTRLTYLLAYPLHAAPRMSSEGSSTNGDPRALRVQAWGRSGQGLLVYETDDLLSFPAGDDGEAADPSEEGPLFTAIYHPAAHTLALWK